MKPWIDANGTPPAPQAISSAIQPIFASNRFGFVTETTIAATILTKTTLLVRSARVPPTVSDAPPTIAAFPLPGTAMETTIVETEPMSRPIIVNLAQRPASVTCLRAITATAFHESTFAMEIMTVSITLTRINVISVDRASATPKRNSPVVPTSSGEKRSAFPRSGSVMAIQTVSMEQTKT
jgi:hypothetical protein